MENKVEVIINVKDVKVECTDNKYIITLQVEVLSAKGDPLLLNKVSVIEALEFTISNLKKNLDSLQEN